MTSAAPATSTSRKPKPSIPLTLLTGFLGAGKTTLVNRLVRDPAFAKAAVIINEFGEVGIDHLLVERAAEGIIELASGCICCTIRGELVDALERLLRAVDNRRIDAIERVVIETTGLADPAPILYLLTRHPYLSLRFHLDGIVTVVDAVNAMATLDAHEEAVRQVAVADCIVLTKAGVPGAATAATVARVGRLNPGVTILDAERGEATAESLIGCGAFDPGAKEARRAGGPTGINEEARRAGGPTGINEEARTAAGPTGINEEAGRAAGPTGINEEAGRAAGPTGINEEAGRAGGPTGIKEKRVDVRRWLAAEAFDHHDGDGHDHDADVNRHDAHIAAFALVSDRAMPASAVMEFLDRLVLDHGSRLLRVKGLLAIAETPGEPVVIQGVQGIFAAPVPLATWPDADHRSRLVVIGRDLDRDAVATLFDAAVGEIRVDAPDRTALFDNPLAILGRAE